MSTPTSYVSQRDRLTAHLATEAPTEVAEKNDLRFLVLSDVRANVIDRCGLRYEVDAETRALFEAVGNDVGAHNGPAGWVLPALATFVTGVDRAVRYANVRGNWTERAEPEDVRGRTTGRTAAAEVWQKANSLWCGGEPGRAPVGAFAKR